MKTVEIKKDGDSAVIYLCGRIDASNAEETEKSINDCLKASGNISKLSLDFDKLEYISSAGLRILLRLKKEYGELTVVNVHSEIYEILDMTGFIEMMKVEKAYRSISVKGCKVIGEGSNGIVYRTDPETIVKVYKNADAIDDIKHEREVARKALILGIPTAISYDIVKVGDSFASVFELINAESLSEIINKNPSDIDKCVDIYVSLLKQIHGTVSDDNSLPSQKQITLSWVEYLKDKMDKDQYEKLHALVDAVKETSNIIHGDFHTKNIMVQKGEVILIDMDTLATGNPVFEFASIYLGFRGFSELDHKTVEKFLSLTWDQANYFLDKAFEKYFNCTGEALESIKNKARLLGLVRLLRRTLKREPDNKERIDFCSKTIAEILPSIDSLSL